MHRLRQSSPAVIAERHAARSATSEGFRLWQGKIYSKSEETPPCFRCTQGKNAPPPCDDGRGFLPPIVTPRLPGTHRRSLVGGRRRQPSIFRLEATKAATSWDGTLVVRSILWRISLARLKKTAFGRFFACARSDSLARILLGREECVMRSYGPAFVAVLALAFAITISVATPPGALKQATAFLGF